MLRMTWCGLSAMLLAAMVGGCASSTETAEKDKLTEHVGVYPPPAAPAQFTCGVPQFKIAYSDPDAKKLESLAADQTTSLMFQTRRFNMVQRAQMDKALAEQKLEGIVDPKQMAKAGKMSGARFLVAGKVTNLRVKAEKTERGLGIGRVTGMVGIGGFDYKKKDSKISVECGVDLSIFDSTTGDIIAAHFGEYKRIDTIEAIGVDILGASASANADLKIDKDNKGKILRLALDECIRKMLPDIDSGLAKVSAATPAKTLDTPKTVDTPKSVDTPVTPPVAAKKFCGQCGKEMGPAAKFCSSCGAKAE